MDRFVSGDLARERADRELGVAQREGVGVHAFDRAAARLEQLDRAAIAATR